MDISFNETDTKTLIAALCSVIPEHRLPTPLHEPEFSGNEWKYVKSCIDDGWVSSVGSFVDQFEKNIAQQCGAQFAIATVNGTAALHAALMVSGVGAGDEVLVPALTFVATANAVSYTGATPHFIESDKERLGVDVQKLETYLEHETVVNDDDSGRHCRNKSTHRFIKAIIPMHVFGHPVDMDSLNQVAQRFGLVVIEDAAESMGSYYKGQSTGSLGHLGALSFNGNKIITSGGGGAVVTNDEAMALKIRHLCTTAKIPHAWSYEHDMTGYNYRLPNINAALGCAQLEQLETFVQKKRSLADAYQAALENIASVEFITEPNDSTSNYWLNAIKLPENTESGYRDQVLEELHNAGLMCRPVWNLVSNLPMYRECPAMKLSVAENLERRIINLPSTAKLAPT